MKLQSILFPTDFSAYNREALEYASTLASESGAKLHIAYVHDPRDLSTTMGDASYLYAATWQQERDAACKRLVTIVPTRKNVVFEHHCLVGRPDDEIVTLAHEKNADLIVMASHGRTGLSRLLMGSIAEGVMRGAPCPVLIVKHADANESKSSTETPDVEAGAIR
jgi:nucleotide-binding universal stress UspA family protein